MGWTSPFVLSCIGSGLALLVAFTVVESKIAHPMFKLALFRIRPFTFGVLSSFLSAVARGGLMFMLIIWLQGIWLPEHGYSFASTPLSAAVGDPLRPLRRAAVRDRRHARVDRELRPARAAPGRLLVPRLRRDPAPDG